MFQPSVLMQQERYKKKDGSRFLKIFSPQAAQQIIELQEAAQINAGLQPTNLGRNTSLHDMKTVVKTWRNRLPIVSDDLSHWSSIFMWRQHHYQGTAYSSPTALPPNATPVIIVTWFFFFLRRCACVAGRHTHTDTLSGCCFGFHQFQEGLFLQRPLFQNPPQGVCAYPNVTSLKHALSLQDITHTHTHTCLPCSLLSSLQR